MTDKLLTEIEASEIVGLKVKTLQNRRMQKKPPIYLKVGSKIYYRMEDLKNYLDDCVVNPEKK